jgi:hypothetical protein
MLGLLILVFALCWLVAIVAGGVYLCRCRKGLGTGCCGCASAVV